MLQGFIVARLCPNVHANPGWVPTKIGGAGASDDWQKGYQTQTWLAVSQDQEAQVSGRYFYDKKLQSPQNEINDIGVLGAMDLSYYLVATSDQIRVERLEKINLAYGYKLNSFIKIEFYPPNLTKNQ